MSKHVHEWTKSQIEFMMWVAQSRYDRDPPTQEQMARRLNVNTKTLTRWKRLPNFYEEVREFAKELFIQDAPEIYGAIRREAKKGASVQYSKLALTMLGDDIDLVKHSGEVKHNHSGNVKIYIPHNGRD